MPRPLALLPVALALCATAAWSQSTREPAWPDIAASVWDGRALQDGSGLITIHAPVRTMDDARTRIAARADAPRGDALVRVSLILDENPMPVSAVFDLVQPQPAFFFDVTFRVNGPTPLHVVAETASGALLVAQGYVKTSGQGACSAPPGTDPEAALATLGDMELALSTLGGTAATDPGQALEALVAQERQLDIDISHPSHSGMQMDQISLLFIPMRFVESVDVALDGAPFAAVTGSISLSENPSLSLSVPGGTRSADVEMTDTDGTVTRAHTALAGF